MTPKTAKAPNKSSAITSERIPLSAKGGNPVEETPFDAAIKSLTGRAPKKHGDAAGFLESSASMRKHIDKLNGWTINPRIKQCQHWDLIILIAMVFTALVTPFEVVFLTIPIGHWLFFINRGVDGIFVFDMILNFFLQYWDELYAKFVTDHKLIIKRYLTFWFWLDLLSIIPFDLVGEIAQSPEIKQMKMMRTIRLMRLLKLARILRASRIFKRWETSLSIRYSVLSLIKFMIYLFVVGHWLACMWAMTALSANEGETTWMSLRGWDMSVDGVALLYGVSLHWSFMTITSIGYGDIIPGNETEFFVCVAGMVIGATLWAYIIGNCCAIVSSMDPKTVVFHNTMDELNEFMADRNLHKEMRMKLREFFHSAKRVQEGQGSDELMRAMSPKLRGEVAYEANASWLCKVWYFSECEREFLISIALVLRVEIFGPQEEISSQELHILHTGLAASEGRVVTKGMTWGEDMVLTSEHLAKSTPTRSLTFVEVFVLPKQLYVEVLDSFPVSQKMIRRATCLLAFQRAVLHVGKGGKYAHLYTQADGNGSLSQTGRSTRLYTGPGRGPTSQFVVCNKTTFTTVIQQMETNLQEQLTVAVQEIMAMTNRSAV